jgi:inositol-pentakisphosphate 2-kinase
MSTSESPLVSIISTSPQDWKYISEGAANIVFSYNGDPHRDPYFNGKVLRLRKSASTVSREIPGFPSVDRLDDPDEPDDPIIEFQHKIIQRLIPSEYLPRLTPIRVEGSWLQDLAKLCDSDRPSHRRQKDGVDLTRTKAVLATDLVGSDAFAVEIKASSVVGLHHLLYQLTPLSQPKWAFLPSPTHLSAATFPIKMKTCRFCMHTHYRSQNDHAIPICYCPLDLFSGDERRIDKALRDLWAGWIDSNGTMNNMRIFTHGKMLKPTEVCATSIHP